MQMILAISFWLCFTGLFAYMQGLLLPTLRLTPPGPTADLHDLALHKIGLVVWLLPAVVFWDWRVLVMAFLVRFIAFDPVLNIAAGDKPFAVGDTAITDRLLRWIAGEVGVPVGYLSALLRVLGIVSLAWWVFVICGKENGLFIG